MWTVRRSFKGVSHTFPLVTSGISICRPSLVVFPSSTNTQASMILSCPLKIHRHDSSRVLLPRVRFFSSRKKGTDDGDDGPDGDNGDGAIGATMTETAGEISVSSSTVTVAAIGSESELEPFEAGRRRHNPNAILEDIAKKAADDAFIEEDLEDDIDLKRATQAFGREFLESIGDGTLSKERTTEVTAEEKAVLDSLQQLMTDMDMDEEEQEDTADLTQLVDDLEKTVDSLVKHVQEKAPSSGDAGASNTENAETDGPKEVVSNEQDENLVEDKSVSEQAPPQEDTEESTASMYAPADEMDDPTAADVLANAGVHTLDLIMAARENPEIMKPYFPPSWLPSDIEVTVDPETGHAIEEVTVDTQEKFDRMRYETEAMAMGLPVEDYIDMYINRKSPSAPGPDALSLDPEDPSPPEHEAQVMTRMLHKFGKYDDPLYAKTPDTFRNKLYTKDEINFMLEEIAETNEFTLDQRYDVLLHRGTDLFDTEMDTLDTLLLMQGIRSDADALQGIKAIKEGRRQPITLEFPESATDSAQEQAEMSAKAEESTSESKEEAKSDDDEATSSTKPKSADGENEVIFDENVRNFTTYTKNILIPQGTDLNHEVDASDTFDDDLDEEYRDMSKVEKDWDSLFEDVHNPADYVDKSPEGVKRRELLASHVVESMKYLFNEKPDDEEEDEDEDIGPVEETAVMDPLTLGPFDYDEDNFDDLSELVDPDVELETSNDRRDHWYRRLSLVERQTMPNQDIFLDDMNDLYAFDDPEENKLSNTLADLQEFYDTKEEDEGPDEGSSRWLDQAAENAEEFEDRLEHVGESIEKERDEEMEKYSVAMQELQDKSGMDAETLETMSKSPEEQKIEEDRRMRAFEMDEEDEDEVEDEAQNEEGEEDENGESEEGEEEEETLDPEEAEKDLKRPGVGFLLETKRNPYRSAVISDTTVEAMYHLNKSDPERYNHRALAELFGFQVPAVRSFLRMQALCIFRRENGDIPVNGDFLTQADMPVTAHIAAEHPGARLSPPMKTVSEAEAWQQYQDDERYWNRTLRFRHKPRDPKLPNPDGQLVDTHLKKSRRSRHPLVITDTSTRKQDLVVKIREKDGSLRNPTKRELIYAIQIENPWVGDRQHTYKKSDWF